MDSDGGDWTSVSTQRKGKKKKKARTLSLQTFFSENPSNPETCSTISEPPELTTEELVIRTSLFSYFNDVIKRIGPIKGDNEKLHEEVHQLSEEGQNLIQKHGGILSFLDQNDDISMVDNYLCAKADVDQAQSMALEVIMNNVGPIIQQRSRPPAVMSVPPVSQFSQQQPNAWNIKPAVSSSSIGIDRLLQLPKVESLFSYGNDMLSPSVITTRSLGGLQSLPNPITPPQSSISGSLTGLGPVGIGAKTVPTSLSHTNSATSGDSNLHNTIESLNKRLNGLSLANTDLLKQLADKETQIQQFSRMIGPQTELRKNYEKIKLELETTKKELDKQKQQNQESHPNGHDSHELPSAAESQLIIALQKQLESEKLNSCNLKKQLELERTHSRHLQDRLNSYVLMGSGNKYPSTTRPLPASSGLEGPSDSLGLRSLLANTSSVFNSISTSSTTSSSASLVPTSSSAMAAITSDLNGATTTAVTTSSTAFQSSASLIKVFEELKRSFPSVSDSDLHRHIQALRSKYGKLSGYTVNQIVLFVSELISKEIRG